MSRVNKILPHLSTEAELKQNHIKIFSNYKYMRSMMLKTRKFAIKKESRNLTTREILKFIINTGEMYKLLELIVVKGL